MRVPVETYRLVCDCCGQTFENGEGYTCYSDCPDEIENDATDSGWVKTEDGHHYCGDCHEWTDDDVLLCKDGRKYDECYEPLAND